ncbi:MAG: anhydro-N-acetylmuramic acid kinase [Chitinophagaceae bacterium]|nr:anhydro-N-acetylmuramic acid kinase [Chitinophagaceae bacterium]MBK8951411.1 anhydro-N-acetylmuramic acid kinase [Chitinophagaceae bacterium]
MFYRAIGLMSGSSLDGLDIAFVEFQEQGGKWTYEIKAADCLPYEEGWAERLKNAIHLSALDYQLLHTSYGHYLGKKVNEFIDAKKLHYQVGLVSSHGHTTFHLPQQGMTGQIGDGAAIAAETGLPVVSDLRAVDVAFGGQGAPIVPIGEKLLMPEYDYFLNIGGIANISVNREDYVAFDVCPANRVLNMLANEAGKAFDEGGAMAAGGQLNTELLDKLNALDYYAKPWPKSLANDFGTDVVYPLIKSAGCTVADALHTFSEHVAIQVSNSVKALRFERRATSNGQLLITGGGALNTHLVNRIAAQVAAHHIDVVVPEAALVNYKEAIIMAFIGVLRWRQEKNVLASVTGARRDSVGGALWMGTEG